MKNKLYLLFPKIYRFLYFILLLKIFIKGLFKNKKLCTANSSKLAYEKYDNREIIDYYNNKTITIKDNKAVYISYINIRKEYYIYLNNVIDELLKKKEKIKILEVGCGNCINLLNLSDKYKNKVKLSGIDISKGRINIAKKEFGKKLDGINLGVADITSKTGFNENEFDLVFSIHVLEQLPYQVNDAIKEYYRLSNSKILFIEPIWEHSDYLQKLYLIESDHVKFLYQAIKLNDYKINFFEKSHIQSNIYNPSSIIIIDK